MWKKKFFDGKELGISFPFTFTNLASVILPRLDMMGEIKMTPSSSRAKLEPTGRTGGGGHSILEENWRVENGKKSLVLLKKPKDETISLRTEGFIQWLAQRTFQENNLGDRIPKVCEILELPENLEGFTMSEITDSILCSRFLTDSKTLHTDIFHVLIQVSILLQILEDILGLDHRDLKADNLLIRKVPSKLRFYLESQKKHFTITSPFTVCIVDFGFACLGDSDEGGLTAIDAGQGTLPPLDPCPKDGRDLYHLIVSIYAIDSIRNRFTYDIDTLFKTWMEVQGKPTDGLVRRWSHSEWTYLFTSRKDFNHPSCTPKAIIEKIMSIEPNLFFPTA